MDRYSNLFTYDIGDLEGQGQKPPAVNHSSMNAGRAVLCAGMIKVENGQVTLLTNSSGHYKPNKQHFSQAVAILRDEGLDFSEATDANGDDTYNGSVIAIGGPAPPAPGQPANFVMWETFPVADFIRSNGTCAPWHTMPGPPP